MADALLNTAGKNREELEALEVAEGARESQWSKPSFVASLFMGKLREQDVLPYPEQPESDRREGDAFIAKLDAFLREKVDADRIDEEQEIPSAVLHGLAELGAFGIKIPKEYGGLGLSQINYNRALAVVCSHCASLGATLSAHQSIGVPEPLKLFGTPEQKKKYLPRLARGEISAFALTEPEVGSDPARMSTTATPTEDGAAYVLNGTKLWCTNGAFADILIVMAQTLVRVESGPDQGREKKQITAFIVEKGMPGFEVVHRSRFLGIRAIQNAVLKFNNVRVPKENILWGVGKGLKLALITLNAGRLSIPALTIGGMRQGLKIARIWGNERKQWGAAVGVHEAGASKIASLASHLEATEAMTWMAALWVDRGSHDIRLEAAMAKFFSSEHSYRLTDEMVQLRGGRGYETAKSLRERGEKPMPLERALRDARINRIVEGTSEIMKLFIAREALDQHLRIAGDVLNSRASLARRGRALVRSAVFYSIWYPSQWILPVGLRLQRMMLAVAGGDPLHREWLRTRCLTHRLARTVFHLMLRHGPGLEKRQLQLGRVVEIGTDLFAMAALIGRTRSALRNVSGAQGVVADPLPAQDRVLLAQVFCAEATMRIRDRFRSIAQNADTEQRSLAKRVLAGALSAREQPSVREAWEL
jgi:alkylation response protein AidB-like acyl-CoA dehydrogenase